MGADLVAAPAAGVRLSPSAGRATFWPDWTVVVDRSSLRRLPGFVVAHHDAGGDLRLHRLVAEDGRADLGPPPEVVPWAAGGASPAPAPAGARFTLVLASRAADLGSVRVLADENAWQHLGSELPSAGLDDRSSPGAYAVALYRSPHPA